MTEESPFVLQGGVASAAVVFLQQAVLRMIPYFVPSLLLVLLDLVYGIKGARARARARAGAYRPSSCMLLPKLGCCRR